MYVNKEWAETTGAPDNLDWTASTFDAQGNVIVVGNTLAAPGNPDVLITKYDRAGTLLWQQTFAGTAGAQDYGVAVVADASGNCFVAAAITNLTTGLDIAVLKYNSSGTLLWSAAWNGPANLMDAPSCLAIDPSGNIYAAGSTLSTPANPDYALVKLNAGGSVQWSATYDYAGFADVATGIEFDLLNDPVITGGSASAINEWDYATIRYNKISGAQSGVNRVNIPGVGLDNALAFTRDNAGSLFITGYRETAGNKDIQTVKLSSTFGLAWVQNYTGQGLEDIGKAVGGDNLGNVYVTGHTRKTSGGSDFITIKYGPTGAVLWEKRYQAKNDTWIAEANKLAVTNDGGVIVTGTIFDGTSCNFMTVKYSADGKLEWEKEYDGLNGDDKSLDLLADATGNVYVSGLKSTGGGSEYATVKYTYLKKENGTILDGNGEPYCVANELIVKFRPNVVNTDVVDDRGWEYGDLDKVIGTALTNRIEAKLGLQVGGKRLQAFKIFNRLTTADSISISRIGEEVNMYEHWSTFLVEIPDPLDIVVARDSLSTMPDEVEYAEPNHLRERMSLPNDPLVFSQANMAPTVQYPSAHIEAEQAWAVQKGKSYVRVAIADDPLYWAHEDFGDGTYAGSKVIGGWSWPNNAHISHINTPGTSHGTACAGIIGALSNNGLGIAGIAGGDIDTDSESGVSLISLGIANGGNFTTGSNIAAAIVEGSANTQGFGYAADIQNHSWGSNTSNQTEYNAVRTCVQNGCVFVASRGNDGNTDLKYPACYRDGYVLNVGASGTDGGLMTFQNGDAIESSWGGDMDLIAPGTIHIAPSTVDEATRFDFPNCSTSAQYYDCFRGTSAAGPHAAGVAALMMSEHNTENGAPNNLAPEDVEFLLQRYATDIAPGWYDPQTGWGRLSAGNTLAHLDYPMYSVIHSDQPNTTNTSVVTASALFNIPSGYGLAAGLYYAQKVERLDYYTHTFPSTTEVLHGWGRVASTRGVTTNFPTASDNDGVYTFTLNGNQATVVARTYTWQVTHNFLGQQINPVWIPYTPSQLRTAYSLHLFDATQTSISEADITGGLLAYPSPVEDQLFLTIGERPSGMLIVRIVSTSGQLIKVQSVPPGSTGVLTIPVNELSAGVYVVQLIGQSTPITGRFMKR